MAKFGHDPAKLLCGGSAVVGLEAGFVEKVEGLTRGKLVPHLRELS